MAFCIMLVSSVHANGEIKFGTNCHLAEHNNLVCVGFDRYLDLVDWSDMRHPQRLNRLKLKERVNKKCQVEDVALSDQYAYVAIENVGISVVDVHDRKNPREINFVDIDFSERYTKNNYSEQSLVLEPGLLFVISDYINKSSKSLTILDLTDPANPQVLPFKDGDRPITPFHEEYLYSEENKLDDLEESSHGIIVYYYENHLNLAFYNEKEKKIKKIDLSIDGLGIRHLGESGNPVVKVSGRKAAVTMNKRLWIADLDQEKVVGQRDFASEIRIETFKGDIVLVNPIDEASRLCFVNLKDINREIPWNHEDGREYRLVTPSFLLVRDRKEEPNAVDVLCGYDIKNLDAIREVAQPFPRWGKNVDNILITGTTMIGVGDAYDNEHGAFRMLSFADGRDSAHPKACGMIKGLRMPRIIKIKDSRLYVVDNHQEGDDFIGIPKLIDISNLEKPVIMSVYNGN